MAAIIRHRAVVDDSWQLLEVPADSADPLLPASGDIVVALSVWLDKRAVLLQRPGRVGVWLDGDDEPESVAGDLRNFGVVAVRFKHFTDGRGYSLARLLRERYAWRGELRAIGDIARDQLFYLSRAGFDAFALRGGEDPHAALAAFDEFSDSYQAAADRPLPLFRRRLAVAHDGMERS